MPNISEASRSPFFFPRWRSLRPRAGAGPEAVVAEAVVAEPEEPAWAPEGKAEPG